MEWGRWMERGDLRRVARHKIKGVRVSTVFLGLDQSFSYTGTPVLFETMVFGGEMDGHQVRYCTWDEALAGHKVILAKVKEIMNA